MKFIPLLLTTIVFSLTHPLSAQEGEDPNAPPSVGDSNSNEKDGATETEAPKVGLADPKTGRLPKLTEELSRQALEAFTKREWDKARAAYAKILEVEPGNALALANLGAVEYQTGNFDKAQTYLEAAVKYNPRLDQSWLVLGMIYYEKEQINLAISALTRALHENPLDPRAHTNLAIVIKSIGWTNGAELELQRAIEIKPDYAGAHFNLALMYLDRKPPALELAARHYDEALKLGAKPDPIVQKRLGRD